MSHEEDIEARFSRLAKATAGVRPRADFSNRVMQRIGAEQAFSLAALRSPASRFLPFGMLAAALALVWAVSVNNQVNEAVASSDDTELAW
jgi:hypothetical protein